jgi:hypothetical protein
MLFAIATASAVPALAQTQSQTQQVASVQSAALDPASILSEQTKPELRISPPGTVDVEPESDWIATGAPRNLLKYRER